MYIIVTISCIHMNSNTMPINVICIIITIIIMFVIIMNYIIIIMCRCCRVPAGSGA